MSSDRLKLLEKMHADDPADTFILFAIAKEFENLDQVAKAIEYYQKLREIDKDYIGLYYHLGKVFEETEEIERAQTTYKEGIEVAKKIKDQHSLSELKGVLLNLEIENGL